MKNLKKKDECTLLKRCCDNDIKAQEFIYKQYYGYAMSIIMRYASNQENAKEILNDSFLKVFRNIEIYDSEKNFKSWLRQIIINTCIDEYRASRRNPETVNEEKLHHLLKDSANIIDNMNAKEILRIIQKLPDNYRIVFNLYEIEGYSHEEIAEKLSIAISTSRSILTRAKNKLRYLMEIYYG